MHKVAVWFFVPYILFLFIGLSVYFSGVHGDCVWWVNRHRFPLFDHIMPWVTYLGDGIIYALVTLLFLLKQFRLGLIWVVMGLCQLLLSSLPKRVIFSGMPRPKAYFAELDIPLNFLAGVKVHSYNSFPSGHTLTAFTMATFLALLIPNRRLALLFLLLAVSVGYSRIYLLQHFLIDVCVGSLLGVGLGVCTYVVADKWRWL